MMKDMKSELEYYASIVNQLNQHLDYGNHSRVKEILAQKELQPYRFRDFKENFDLLERETTMDTKPT